MIRSLFFAPANRHDLLTKFPRFRADCYAIDLEDGTPEGDKDSARARLDEAVRMLRGVSLQGRLYVRVNEASSKHYIRDIEAAVLCDIDGLIVPKLESRDQLFPVDHAITRAEAAQTGRRRIEIMAGIESMRGVIDAVALCAAHPRITSAFFGAEDFASDIGARRTRTGDEVLYARSQVVLAAKAARIIAIDQAVVEIRDDEQFRRDAEKGRDLGYEGKICVVPRQVELSNEIYAPTADEIAHARELVAVYQDAMQRGIGTIDFKGHMIDGPLLKRAEAVLELARQLEARA
ncbi:CoA ester lyase [Ferrovibrio terrae]|uniref:CoA ester lyase n=1 Tax=Ferrovibrio terrae TaxID=2594003 RepID=A0A516H031_9PROT|nr:CoA ester lyase [Ferrovibrio terrae]QDO97116.1 CoA ester lyase [Ferrovibrio terrae]